MRQFTQAAFLYDSSWVLIIVVGNPFKRPDHARQEV